MVRKIIEINEELCNGCGDCVPNCPEGALQVLDGKARLVSDLFCDGLGACLGECPVGAITVVEREAEPYNERIVMENIILAGPETIKAHLKHLHEHGEKAYLETALEVLKAKGLEVPVYAPAAAPAVHQGCPSSQARAVHHAPSAQAVSSADIPSELSSWPIQMHLINPASEHFANADLLLAADCTAFSLGGFHGRLLSGKKLAIACPKLDTNQEIYIEKLASMIVNGPLRSITVAVMEVPCCRGLLGVVQEALSRSGRKIDVNLIIVGIEGGILKEQVWARAE